jgi:signal transduction histidine kinase
MTAVPSGGGLKFVKVLRDETARKLAEDRLRESEGRLRVALTAAEMGTWYWDIPADRQTTDANLTRLLGGGPVETSQPLDAFLARLHPDDRDRVRDDFLRTAREGTPLRTEFRVPRRDGTVRWLRDQGEVFRDAAGGPLYMTGACVDITALKGTEEALRAARDELEARVRERTAELAAALGALEGEMARRNDLGRRLATAQEDERRRLARDLHDTVGQTLTGLSLAAAGGRLEQVRELADALGRELHEVAVRLRPTALDDIGLEAGVRALAADWSRRGGVPVEVQAAGLGEPRLPAEVESVLYRVVQEALTNAAKHARATSVSVVVGRREGEAVAVVEDDGVGFDPDALPPPPAGRPGGLGLLGMRERVALLGGVLEVESAPGAGTTVYARIPLPGH